MGWRWQNFREQLREVRQAKNTFDRVLEEAALEEVLRLRAVDFHFFPQLAFFRKANFTVLRWSSVDGIEGTGGRESENLLYSFIFVCLGNLAFSPHDLVSVLVSCKVFYYYFSWRQASTMRALASAGSRHVVLFGRRTHGFVAWQDPHEVGQWTVRGHLRDFTAFGRSRTVCRSVAVTDRWCTASL
jgi:hypothetical protein